MPLYYLCIVFYFFTETFLWKDVPSDPYGLYWIRYILPLNGLIPAESDFWSNLGITWTTPVFLYFYLLFPILIKLIDNFTKSVIFLATTICLAIVVNRFLNGFLSAFSYYYVFALGISTYYAQKEKKQPAFCCILAIISLSSLFRFADKSYGISAMFALLIIASSFIEIKKAGICKIIGKLDEYSYTVYLVHGIVFCGFLDKINMSQPLTALVSVFGTLALVIVVHNLYEKPIIRFLSSLQNN